MNTPLYEVDLLKFRYSNSFATVRVLKLDNGLSTEWWVSHNLGDNIQVVAQMFIPVLGSDVGEAERRCALIAKEVVEFASWAGIGEAGVPGASDEPRRAHCLAHIQEYLDSGGSVLGGGVKVNRTVALYRLALGFNINNPASLIAQAEGVESVKAIHERLQYGRRLGLLDSPGKGSRRTKSDRV